MMKKSLLCSALCAVMLLIGCEKNDPQPFDDYLKLTLNSSATESKLTKEMLKSATKIKISGSINAADFKTLREHQELEYLNLGDATVVGAIIVGYDFNEDTNKYEPLTVEGNAIPFGAFGAHDDYEAVDILAGTGIDTTFFNDFTGKGRTIRPSQDRIDKLDLIEEHKQIKSIVLPKKITHIGRNAFSTCKTLTEPVEFPATVRNIMNSAFSQCENMKGEFKFPAEIKVIGNIAFQHCRSMTGALTIPKNINIIFDMAFTECANLTELNLHNQVETIGVSALSGLEKVTKLILPEGLDGIDVSAFSSCSGLKGDLVLPSTLTQIMDRVFYNCSNLDGTLTLNEGLAVVKDYAFHGGNFHTIIAKWSEDGTPIPNDWYSNQSFWFPSNFETSAGKPEYVIYIPKGELAYYTANFPAVKEGESAFYNFKEGTPPKK